MPYGGAREHLKSAINLYALMSACSVVLAEAQADHDAADEPVLCAQAVGPRRRCQPLRMAELAQRMVTLRSARRGGPWNGSWNGSPGNPSAVSAVSYGSCSS